MSSVAFWKSPLSNRRDWLCAVVGGLSAMGMSSASVAQDVELAIPAPRTGVGLVAYCLAKRRALLKATQPEQDLFEPLRFFQVCEQWGAGGMQVRLGDLTIHQAGELRDHLAEHRGYVETIVELPASDDDLPRFDHELAVASAAGALAARTTLMPGRRYESFDSWESYQARVRQGTKSLKRALPVAAKHRVPLALENHKDQLLEERVALFRSIDSEWLGACVDTGNSMALLEDPYETVSALAPYALSVHLKDQAVQLSDDGFLLADIPLGKGCLDLVRIVRVLRERRPTVRFSLELITRDALRVPCLTERYWTTFPATKAKTLAAALQRIRAAAASDLPSVTALTPEEQMVREEQNVRESLVYASRVLKL